jgi:hypothetical protein
MEIVNRATETAVTREVYTVLMEDGELIRVIDTIDEFGDIIDTEMFYVVGGEVPDEDTCDRVIEYITSNPS